MNSASRRSMKLLFGEIGELSAKMCMPFGAETMECDPCRTIGTFKFKGPGTWSFLNVELKF